MISRRSLIGSLGLLIAAPAIVRAESLMRIAAPKLIVSPPIATYNLDDLNDFAAAYKAYQTAFLKAYRERFAGPIGDAIGAKSFDVADFTSKWVGHHIS